MSALSQILEIASDLTPDVRSPLAACAIAVVVLIAALSWFGWDASSPARAAEAAVRSQLGDATLTFEKSRIHYDPPGFTRHRGRLVCGHVKSGPAFAALVWERPRRSAEWAFSLIDRDRVERLALGDQGDPALLAACMRP